MFLAPDVLTVLKWVGGAYLVFLGVQVWRAPAIAVAASGDLFGEAGADTFVFEVGTGGDVIINNPPAAPAPTPSPTPSGPALVTPAAGCPTVPAPWRCCR